MAITCADWYEQGKGLLQPLMTSLDTDRLEQPCVACPEGSIHDLLADHVHVLGARIEGSLPKAALVAVVDADPDTRRRGGEET